MINLYVKFSVHCSYAEQVIVLKVADRRTRLVTTIGIRQNFGWGLKTDESVVLCTMPHASPWSRSRIRSTHMCRRPSTNYDLNWSFRFSFYSVLLTQNWETFLWMVISDSVRFIRPEINLLQSATFSLHIIIIHIRLIHMCLIWNIFVCL